MSFITLKFSILDLHFLTKPLLYGFCGLRAGRFYGLCAVTVKGVKKKSKLSVVIHILKLRNETVERPSEMTKTGHLDSIQIAPNLKHKRGGVPQGN